jgi:hypothetical protein
MYLQGVARTHKNHASDTGGGWARFQIVALTHKNNRDNFFHRIRAPKNLCTHKIMEPNFIRIGPHQVVARTHKVINTTVFGYRPTSKVLLVLTKIMHPTPAADGPAFQIVALTQE